MFTIGQQYRTCDGFVDRERIKYEEVKLPFDQVETDHLEGEELHNALYSREVGEELAGYSLVSEFGDGEYSFQAFRDPGFGGESPYLEAEIGSDRDYSHLRMKLSAPGQRGIERLENDLESIEDGLDSYFREEEVVSYSGSVSTRYGYTD